MLSRLRSRRSLVIGLIAVFTLGALAAAPWALWHTAPDRPLDIVVVDKTVAKPDYRKHAGLFWLLRHEKIVQRGTGQPLRDDRDYAGYQHLAEGQPRIVPIPHRRSDLTYIADTYGVYEDDLPDPARGLRPRLIYGGMSLGEVRAVTRSLRPGATLVGEFNCIARPTVGEAREELSDALGVRWTGWIGRHFPFLDLTVDLPPWIPREWRRQTGRAWQFRGPGYVLVDEQGVMVVLVDGIDTPAPALRITFDESHADRYGTVRRQTYDHWFEVVEPRPRAEVIAQFELELTDSGREKTRGIPIDRPFPAIVRTARPGHLAYYFAGDFADQPKVPSAYRYKWLPKIRSWLGAEQRDDQQAFYWRVYVPVMQHVIREAEATARAAAPDA
jgi:hypothetical protein